jgi:cell division protein FtsI/penicillin-binding protein 2
MVSVAERLGKEKLYEYLGRFGIGRPTGVDLEEESIAPLRPLNQWGQIDLATVSFGQGVAVTPMQMVVAVSAIANGGKVLEPHVVKKITASDREIEVKPKVIGRVLSETTTKIMTEIMVNAVEKGEAKWAKPKGYRIAGKTGTAQIPIAGHYDNEKTIASFVGFAPADQPRFVMLVTLQEPTSSPWGSETAAPLWFDIAKEIFKLWGISPS